jgi:hypothetical protein
MPAKTRHGWTILGNQMADCMEWRIMRISEFILIRSLKAAKRLRIQLLWTIERILTRKLNLSSNNLHVGGWHKFLYICIWSEMENIKVDIYFCISCRWKYKNCCNLLSSVKVDFVLIPEPTARSAVRGY